LPGVLGPSNVVVREPDVREGHVVLSLAGWREYDGPLSLVRPLLKNFVHQTESHFPSCGGQIEEHWVLDAVVEALGRDEALAFLGDLQRELEAHPSPEIDLDLDSYVERLRHRYYQPLPLRAAIRRYRQWSNLNERATPDARLDLLRELQRMYRLDRRPEIARYTLFRRTIFEKASAGIRDALDRLIDRLFHDLHRPATRLVELSDLQAALETPDDRRAFRRLAFPRVEPTHDIEVLTVGDREHGHVIMRSSVEDRRGATYTVAEPTHASEVGQVYRLFLMAGFPKAITETDRYLVLTDRDERIVGGVCYRELEEGMVHLDGIVVSRSLLARGLTSSLLEDFCARMANLGHRLVKTLFLLRRFYLKRGFRT
ncbi:MAG: GNAT family N-acetyltransferase, partial [Phycisphaeraceae bacterium]|nr:GNAT family N-acetyltransferase [Phycisphaeraceae bacterium]